MVKPLNQRGIALLPVILTILTAGIIGFAGWFAYSSGSGNTVSIEESGVQIDASDENSGSANVTQDEKQKAKADNNFCETGIIIVYFKSNVTRQRQQEIIAIENAEVVREYDQFRGYALRTGIGYEKSLSDKLSGYDEVASAQPESCPDPINAPDSLN